MARRKDGVSCTATAKSTGKRCGNPPNKGGTVCRIHGGNAPQVRKANAREVMKQMVGPALVELRGALGNDDVPWNVRMRAVDSILDRNGFKAPAMVEILTPERVEEEIAKLQAERELEG